jgi:hypothetical protein
MNADEKKANRDFVLGKINRSRTIPQDERDRLTQEVGQ